MTASILFPSSRQAFAMVRDGALPFSTFLYKIDTWSGTPTRSTFPPPSRPLTRTDG